MSKINIFLLCRKYVSVPKEKAFLILSNCTVGVHQGGAGERGGTGGVEEGGRGSMRSGERKGFFWYVMKNGRGVFSYFLHCGHT